MKVVLYPWIVCKGGATVGCDRCGALGMIDLYNPTTARADIADFIEGHTSCLPIDL